MIGEMTNDLHVLCADRDGRLGAFIFCLRPAMGAWINAGAVYSLPPTPTRNQLRSRMKSIRLIAVCLMAVTPAVSTRVAVAQEGEPSAKDSAPVLVSLPARTPEPVIVFVSPLVRVNGEAVDRFRVLELSGAPVDKEVSLLLRSASSLTPRRAGPSGPAFSVIPPEVLIVSNTALPFSQNYGSLWAGRGTSTQTSFGIKLEGSRVRVILAPELVSSENRDWLLRSPPFDAPHLTPAIPPDLSGGGFVFPFYVATYPIDQPMRFGDARIRRLDPGQSSVLLSFGRLEAGLSTEHEWWGPGIRNAIVLSNNAPGFPHLLLRTARPLRTRFGNVEARWIVGGLVESDYFDTTATNDVRSLASLAATLETAWDPNLTVGFARSVYATSRGWGAVPFRWLNVFTRTHARGPRTATDTTFGPGGKDQVNSLFARWVFPTAGFEAYAELGRTRLPTSVRDLLVDPNHTQGYTLGLQWARPARRSGGVRLQAEVTQLEASSTQVDRPTGSWYTSRNVVQGYTNRGAILGGSIGPGASSQWLALDYLARGWRFGIFGGRIRWNQDVHSATEWPVHVGYCNHDVSVYPGARAAASGRFGYLSLNYTMQHRMNVFFQNDGGCPNFGPRLDIRNNTLSITFSPFNRR